MFTPSEIQNLNGIRAFGPNRSFDAEFHFVPAATSTASRFEGILKSLVSFARLSLAPLTVGVFYVLLAVLFHLLRRSRLSATSAPGERI
jgi:hypothetical protein